MVPILRDVFLIRLFAAHLDFDLFGTSFFFPIQPRSVRPMLFAQGWGVHRRFRGWIPIPFSILMPLRSVALCNDEAS